MEPDSLEARFQAFRDRGDAVAFADVFDRTAPELFVIARRLVHESAAAEDVVQETFLTAIEARARFDPERSLLPWLVGILVNHARKSRRGAARAARAREGIERASDPREAAAANEFDRALHDAVADLPEHYSRVLALHLVQGLEPREIALRLGLEPSTARVQIHRGLALLRKALPPGFALGGAVASSNAGTLAAARETVLAQAAAVKGATTIPLALVLAIALVASTAAGLCAWMLGSTRSEDGAARELAAVSTPALEVAPADESGVADAHAVEPTAREPATTAGNAAQAPRGTATFRGRLLLDGGAPARGVDVRITNATRFATGAGERTDLPTDWKVPAPVLTDDAGRFELAVPVVERITVDLRASKPGWAAIAWSWPPVTFDRTEPLRVGDVVDLGDTPLVRGGTVELRVVDAAGANAFDGRWTFSITQIAAPEGRGRAPSGQSARLDPVTKLVRFEDVEPGWHSIAAKLGAPGTPARQKLEVRAGETARVDFAMPERPQTRKLRLEVLVERFGGAAPELEHIRLTRPGSDAIGPRPVENMGTSFEWDGLPDGEWILVIDDPRFERLVKPSVKPAGKVSARLRGASAVKLAVVAGPERAKVERYALVLEQEVTGTIWTRDFRTGELVRREARIGDGRHILFDEEVPPPSDGLVDALLPGTFLLRVAAQGRPERTVEVLDLRAGETRELTLDLDLGSRGSPTGGCVLGGVALAQDGKSPLAGLVVQATRGSVAGRRGSSRGMLLERGPGAGSVRVPDVDLETRTDAEGRYRFADIQPGPWTVDVTWSPWLETERTVEVLASGAELDMTQPPSGVLVGKITAPAGVAPNSIELALRPLVRLPRPDVPAMLGGLPEGSIAADGAFRFGPLPAGDVELSVLDASTAVDGASSIRIRTMRPITRARIEAGKETRLDLDLRGAIGGELALVVRVSGAPVELLTAHVLPPDGPVARFETDCALSESGQGTLRAPGGAGPFVVAIEGPGKAWIWSAPDPVAIAPDEKRALALDVPLAKRRVRAVDAQDGTPLASKRLTWSMRAGATVTFASGATDANGELELSLPPGRVEFALPGASKDSQSAVEWPPAAAELLEVRLGAPR